MITLKPVGFYREISHGSPMGPSLLASQSPKPHEHESEILRYLREGVILAACVGFVEDAVNPTRDYVGPPHLMTDGEWAWHGDLIDYVTRYHLELPAEFVAHRQASNWVVDWDLPPGGVGPEDIAFDPDP